MNKKSQRVAILLAILAAALYAVSTPVSKVMLQVVPPTMVAAFLYLGAGIGVGTMMLGATIALAIGESLPDWRHLAIILLLGYVAYGLSIYCYTYAQRTIGAARTSTYYALAPFIGALLSILLLGEPVTLVFTAASLIMAVGCWIAAK